MDPNFYDALKSAKKAGVRIIAANCEYKPIEERELTILKEIPVIGL